MAAAGDARRRRPHLERGGERVSERRGRRPDGVDKHAEDAGEEPVAPVEAGAVAT